jgi:hypothetical protein
MEGWKTKTTVAWLEDLQRDDELEFDVEKVAAPGKVFAARTEAQLIVIAGGPVGIDIYNAKELKRAELRGAWLWGLRVSFLYA